MIKNHNFLDAVNSKVYDINGKIITEFYQENRTPISLSEIPPHLINACIAIEDEYFYQHRGISIRGILRSQWVNFKNIVLRLDKEARLQGGSTITQQLGINTFLTREVSINRKIQDMLIALQIERYFTKDEIMTMYLNEIYFGHGAYGVQAASKMYFNKDYSRFKSFRMCFIGRHTPRTILLFTSCKYGSFFKKKKYHFK